MFADLFFVSILFIGLITATYTDIKRREVPDWINYFLIALGLGGHLIISITQQSIYPILLSLCVAFIFFIVANILFYSGSWGGGDAKFLVAVGALLPTYPETLLKVLTPALASWPFILTLFFNIILFGAIIGIIFTFYSIAKNYKKVKKNLNKLMKKPIVKISRIILIISVLPLIFGIIKQVPHIRFLTILWLTIIFFFYIVLLSKASENISMLKKVKPSDLTEGDWIAEDVKVNNKIVYKKRRIGIEKKYIKLLKNLESEGKLNSVKIKEGLPFLPSFLLGIIFTLIVGDIMFICLSTLI